MEYSPSHHEHNLKLIYGFESYLENPSENTPEAIYLKSTLSLHGMTFDAVEGTEGWVDQLKSAGKRFYEFILSILRAIKNFFFGPKGSKDDKKITQAVASLDVTARKLPDLIKQAEPEVQQHIEQKAEQLVEGISLPFNVAKGHNKFFDNVNGVVTDAYKAAKLAGLTLPNLDAEIKRANELYENLQKNIENIKVAKKSGDMMGVISTLSQAAYLGGIYKGLRDEYKKILDKLTPALEAANINTNDLEKNRNTSPDTDKAYRTSRKVTVFLADYVQSMERAINNCTKNVSRIAEKFNSMIIKLNYESPATEQFKDVQDVSYGIE
ncbi:hypothetical protein [Aeromonas phage ZPAH34]|uniref:hypothetical protein n=1 Tax=Aeromonas phage ZPAH34 TaxID=2924888 RepID=UPI002329277C|nr:hypothetical protein PQD16_gp189 [Aeromonas phage ZPAH34]UOX39494.1 hypothetical protein [Aeromonas phage ZPAH34]